MSRLIDQIRAGLCQTPEWWRGDNLMEKELAVFASDTRTATVVVADNVSRYYHEVSDKDEWEVSTDFPNIAPPLDVMWMEARASHVINSKGVLRREDHRVESFGALFKSTEKEAGGWVIGAAVYLKQRGELVRGPLGVTMLNVDPAGRYIEADVRMRNGQIGVPVMVPFANRLDQQSQDVITQCCVDVVKPFLLALSFMHCKNVVRHEVEQPAPLSKKWQKRHGRPLVRYHVLDIDPMREVLRSEGQSEEVGLKRALHICRGHFATYTADKPLFGRVTGTFWKPQHVRGNKEAGLVLKDYRVNGPKV